MIEVIGSDLGNYASIDVNTGTEMLEILDVFVARGKQPQLKETSLKASMQKS